MVFMVIRQGDWAAWEVAKITQRELENTSRHPYFFSGDGEEGRCWRGWCWWWSENHCAVRSQHWVLRNSSSRLGIYSSPFISAERCGGGDRKFFLRTNSLCLIYVPVCLSGTHFQWHCPIKMVPAGFSAPSQTFYSVTEF
jgi:hypothetical protein